MDPFDRHLDDPCPDDCDDNAPHGRNTDEEMDVDADDAAGT